MVGVRSNVNTFFADKDDTLGDYAILFNSGQAVDFTLACDDFTGTIYTATRYGLFILSGTIRVFLYVKMISM